MEEKVILPIYIEQKIKLLRQLGVFLKETEMTHIKSLKTEIAVDQYAHTLFMTRV